MREWRAGDLVTIAAGAAVIAAALLPWAWIDGDGFGALTLRLYQPFVAALAVGVALIVFGWMRTLWGGLVGLTSAFATTVLVLMIHTDVVPALNAFGIPLGSDSTHVVGIGVSVMFVAGFVAGAGGVMTVIEREPPVVTRAAGRPGA